ncbi:hypothetical protein P3342_004583 [Pyrenophora teres f. teres]|nr:hypothetical protein P3342_004583 [Pyrenophora teres f. teres]
MRIHPVFHKKLLEPAPPDAELATDVELEDDSTRSKRLRTCGKTVVSGKQNLTNCKELVQEYHREHPKQQGLNPRRGRSNQKKNQEGRVQPVTSPDQPKVRIAVVRSKEGPYQGSRPPRPVLAPDPENSGWQDPDQHKNALAPQPLGAPDGVAGLHYRKSLTLLRTSNL